MATRPTLPAQIQTASGSWPTTLGRLFLAVFVLAIAALPDEAIARSKLTWGQSTMLAAIAMGLLQQALGGRFTVPWSGFLLASLLLPGLALVFIWHGELASNSLAWDEVQRLSLVPAVAGTVGVLLTSPSSRRQFVAILGGSVGLAAGYALACHLAGTLDLPLERQQRAYGTFGNPVFLGAFLVLCLPLCAASALFVPGVARWTGAVASGLGLPVLLATGTRSAWLGAAVAAVTMILLLATDVTQRRRLIVYTSVIAIIVGAVGWKSVLRPQEHALIWRDTLHLVLAHPLGVGPGQFPLEFLNAASTQLLETYARSAVIINDAHSEPLQVLAELGWPGLAALMLTTLLFIAAARSTLRRVASDVVAHPLAVACCASVAGAVAQSLASPDQRFMITPMVLGMVIGLFSSMSLPWTAPVPGGRAGRWTLVITSLFLVAAAVHKPLAWLEKQRLIAAFPPYQDSPERVERIRQLWKELSGTRPGATELHALGVALSDEHLFPAAVDILGAAREISPDLPGLIADLGYAEARTGRLDEAEGHLQQALSQNPADHRSRYVLAFVHFCRGDIRTAVIEVEALLAKEPSHPQGLWLLERLRE